MRTHGTLSKWNDDRGFGFITPSQGSEELFVHISAFPRDGVRPRLNELISFEIEDGGKGKKRAIRVLRPGKKAAHRTRSAERTERGDRSARTERRNRRIGPLLALVLFGTAGTYGYSALTSGSLSAPGPARHPARDAASAPMAQFECDGRTECSQMTSCEEAEFFLQHCPNTLMDGNGDGEPCERQWCNQSPEEGPEGVSIQTHFLSGLFSLLFSYQYPNPLRALLTGD